MGQPCAAPFAHLESDEFVLALRGTPVRVLGKNRDLGCWGSVRRLEPSEDYYVLSDDENADAVAGRLAVLHR